MDKKVLEREEKFHNEWAKTIDPKSVKVDELETACTLPETRYIIEYLGNYNLKRKKILEIGCGCGEASVYFAKHGADVYCTDLSDEMVMLAEKVAEYHKTTIHGISSAADHLPFEAETFDIVYAANVLHHVDIEKTLDEIKRVLKKDGIYVAWDPIKYNPIINVYRKMASEVRTIDEHPIDRSYLQNVKKRFHYVESKGFWFMTNFIFLKYYFIDKLNPSKVRYWKKIIDDSDRLATLYFPLERVDKILLKVIPPLKWLCWNMVVIARK